MMRMLSAGNITCFLNMFFMLLFPLGQDRQPVPVTSLLHSGDTLMFIGDSITEQGDQQEGFVRLVRKVLNQHYEGFHIRVVNAGVSGNKIEDVSARFDHIAGGFKPDWLVISIGINDVWHRLESNRHFDVYLPHFESELDSVVTKAQRHGVKVALFTTTVITEDINNKGNQLLQLYNEAIRRIAKNRSCLLIDVNKLFSDVLLGEKPQSYISNLLTTDGVHLNKRGNKLMASAVLKSFGFNNPL